MPPTTKTSVRDLFDDVGRGLQHQGLRRSNERAVLTVISAHSGISNAGISRRTGLAPQTVSAILIELDRAGLIERGEVLRGRRGQPATPISLRADGALAFGIEIGWQHVRIVLINLLNQVVARDERRYGYPDATNIVDLIGAMLEPLMETLSADQRTNLCEVGVTLPGDMTDVLRRLSAPAEQRGLWEQLDLAAALEAKTGLAVTLVNDGNAACWAELVSAPQPRPTDFIYFLLSNQLAAGVVGNGTLWEGPNGNSANLGAMLVSDDSGRLFQAHELASIVALEARLAEAGIDVSGQRYKEWNWSTIEPVVSAWITDAARALARVVFNTTTVIESGVVVLDTVLPAAVRERLGDALKRELLQLPVKEHAQLIVMQGHLGADAPAIGAADLVLYRRHFSRTLADLAS